jgi:hypothetical protein
MATDEELNEAFRKLAERRGLPYQPRTARDILRGHTALFAFGTDPTVPARHKPPTAEFKDAGAGI